MKLGQKCLRQGLTLATVYERTHCWDGQNQLYHHKPLWQNQAKIIISPWRYQRDSYSWTALWLVLYCSSHQSYFPGVPSYRITPGASWTIHLWHFLPPSSPHPKQELHFQLYYLPSLCIRCCTGFHLSLFSVYLLSIQKLKSFFCCARW